jgi:lipoprotein-releasing system ATP-binding protein
MLRVENLTKIFRSGEQEVAVFEGLNLQVGQGELLALVGRSGSGKTTLLHLLAALDTPTRGEIYFGGQRLGALNFEEQAEYRNRQIGFVWQMHHLLPEFSALENVMLPQLIAGSEFEKAQGRARELLAEVGLENALGRRTGELSGVSEQASVVAGR